MGRTLYRDLDIRGTVYPDAASAAAALGITPDAVRIAARKGTLHRAGTGASHPEPLPVRIRGQHFASVRAAAAHFGLVPSAIYTAIAQGREDRVGIHPRNASCGQPFRIGGLAWPSMAAASRALGFAPGFVAGALKGRPRNGMERIASAAMQEARRRERAAQAATRRAGRLEQTEAVR